MIKYTSTLDATISQFIKSSSAVANGKPCGTEDNPCVITTPSFGFGRSLPLPVTISNSFMNAVPIRTEEPLCGSDKNPCSIKNFTTMMGAIPVLVRIEE